MQNPDIVLVHYLNVPYPDDNKMVSISPSLALWGDKKEWTKEELVSQLKPMCESLGRVPRGAHQRPSHHQMHPFSNSSTGVSIRPISLSLFFFLHLLFPITVAFITFIHYSLFSSPPHSLLLFTKHLRKSQELILLASGDDA